MNGKLFWIRSIGLIVTAALLAACAAAPANPTVTAGGNACTYSGPKRLPSTFTITWAVKETKPSMDYMFIVATLGEGKTGADLAPFMGDAEADAPDWMDVIRYGQMVNETQTQTVDLTIDAAYHGEPIYIICTAHRVPIGFVGPLEVEE